MITGSLAAAVFTALTNVPVPVNLIKNLSKAMRATFNL